MTFAARTIDLLGFVFYIILWVLRMMNLSAWAVKLIMCISALLWNLLYSLIQDDDHKT